MDNLWILTEEKPKISVLTEIFKLYCNDFTFNLTTTQFNNIKIKPIFKSGVFQFTYVIESINLPEIGNIFLKIVSGNSSFLDFLVFKQKDCPIEGQMDNLLMGIEETKTSDEESRNTGVYQRASKFAFITPYITPKTKLYMLYNDELCTSNTKKPSDTSIFGTSLLLTLGINILGKDISKYFTTFNSIQELATFKNSMRKPPRGNVPINITQHPDKIEISGRLSKPATAGNIGHDPNIGALTLIAKTLRYLGWDKSIILTQHGVKQSYIDKLRKGNKFIYICNLLDITLEGIDFKKQIDIPNSYWHYEKSSEKVASILLHIIGEYSTLREIYQNHAGCERGYFKTLKNNLITLPKKDLNGENLYIPDLILHNPETNSILLVEGKKYTTLHVGLEEINNYDSIEAEYLTKFYPNCSIHRCLTIFGDNKTNYLNPAVFLYLTDSGNLYLNDNFPQEFLSIFEIFNIETPVLV